jgi:dynein heavy chain
MFLHIKKEIFLEDLDSLLTSGNIPDLFDNDELDTLFMELKNDALMEGISDEKSELYRYLINVQIIII